MIPIIRRRFVLPLAALLFVASASRGQTPSKPAAEPDAVLGTVDGIPIRQFEWDRLAEPYYRQVESEAGRKLSDNERRLLRQNVLNELIRERLWLADARKRAMKVSEAEIDARLRQSQFFKTNGRVDESKFQAFKRSPTSNYPFLRSQMETGLLLEQYSRWMERRFAPHETELQQAFRDRTSQATIRYLLLGPDAVSLEAEATDADVRRYYEDHASEFQAAEEAHIQYVKVQAPAAAADTSKEAASQASLKAAKDLLAAIQAGAPPETAARIHGGFHDSGPFKTGDPIRGLGRSDALTDAVHATEPGAWIREPVRVGNFYVVARVVERKAARAIPFRDAVGAAKRRVDVARRDAEIDSLARAELTSHRSDYTKPRLVASTVARPIAAFEDPRPVGEKEIAKALERARKAAKIKKSNRAWLDSVRTTLPASIAAARRSDAVARAMADIANDLRRGDAAEAVASRRLASVSKVDLWKGQPPAQTGLADGPFLDSLYTKRPGDVIGPRAVRDTAFVTRVESLDLDYMPPYEAVKSEARSAALLNRRRTTEAEAENWFADRRDHYTRPLRFIVDAVLFSKTKTDTTTVPEDSIAAYHRDHPLEFTEPARVKLRHILFASKADDPPRVKEAVRAKALGVRARLLKGEDFEELARQVSDDKGSGARGGDLGEILRSQVAPDFGAAAFALAEGEISEPVLTQFGYHLIRVDKRFPERLRPLDECRSEIKEFLAKAYADTVAWRGANALIAAATDSASLAKLAEPEGGLHRYGPVGNTDRLGPIGPALGLSDWLTPVADGAIAPTPLVVEEGYLVARKVKDVAPSQAPFAEVKDRVVQDYLQSRRRAASDSVATRFREALASGADLESLSVAVGGLRTSKPFGRSGPIPDLSRDPALGRDSLYLERVFSSKPGATLPPLQGSSGTLFAKVEAVNDPPPADYSKRRDELRREIVEQRMEAWTERLRSRATISIARADLRGLLR